MSKPKVAIVLADGFEEIEAVTIIDVLRRASIDVLIAGVETLEVRGAHDLVVRAEVSIQTIQAKAIDMIVLPGGWSGTKTLAQNSHVQALLKEINRSGKTIAAICAAPFALDAAGVLKAGYTCYPSVAADIKTSGFILDQKVVKTDNIITSQGPATALCFALFLVEELLDRATAAQLKKALLGDHC